MSIIGAIDQGTSSSRFLFFSTKDASVLAQHQIELKQSFPQDGWVEMDPVEIWETTRSCIREASAALVAGGDSLDVVAGLGLANQRETTVAWDKATGKPLYPAIVWLDARTSAVADALADKTATKSKDAFRDITGLPISPYFSALKLHWLFKNVAAVRNAFDQGRLMAGTIDSWVIWNLTGGTSGGAFVTDVTNASRTMLMNIKTRKWDQKMCDFFEVPMSILADIHSSAEVYGTVTGTGSGMDGKPIAGCLGDQQAALVGQGCLRAGEAKNTYGTGCFLLCNTGPAPVISSHGLLTTVAFQLGPTAPVHYALEGAVAVAGAAVRWLRDSLHLVPDSAAVEALAASVPSSGGVTFVPAFSGLYAPHWDSTARGTLLGLSFGSGPAHIARATLEAVAWQSREILDAMGSDAGRGLDQPLRVDGGMAANGLLLQLQADALDLPVQRPVGVELTALGAALAAGVATGVWEAAAATAAAGQVTTFQPSSTKEQREKDYRRWLEAVKRSKGWTNFT